MKAVLIATDLIKTVTMEQIAKELSKLNATMAEILYLIQKEMKKSEELSKKWEKERNE